MKHTLFYALSFALIFISGCATDQAQLKYNVKLHDTIDSNECAEVRVTSSTPGWMVRVFWPSQEVDTSLECVVD